MTENDFSGGGAQARNQDFRQCQAQAQMLPANANPSFYAAAAQQTYVNDCIAAKGYRGP